MIDTYAEFISQIGHQLIRGVFVSVLLLIAVRIIFKSSLNTVISLNRIRWIITG